MEKKHYPRILNLPKLLEKKSHFLFGPRSTGKTTLIQEQFDSEAVVFDLLERDTYRRLLQDPSLLGQVGNRSIVVIDEIQKIPSLLDEVHRLIQKRQLTFLLTGSSARKLKYGSANLLAGRAWQARLHPLVSAEIPDFDLETYLTRGGLPHIYVSKHWQKELKAYVSLYLREEVAAEALTRNVEAFSEFLDLVAISNGQELNYQNFANDCGVSVNTIKNYFSILEDTLIGFSVPAYTLTMKRKAISRSKHYLFDPGIVNTLVNQSNVKEKSPAFGGLFEQFILLETRAALSYLDMDLPLRYWRSVNKQEVDVVLGTELAIEIKSSKKTHPRHLKGLRALMEEKQIKRFMLVSLDKINQTTDDGIECIYWREFLDRLWKGKLI